MADERADKIVKAKVKAHNDNKHWLNVYVAQGSEKTIERMGGCCTNLSLVALLTGGVAIAISSHDALSSHEIDHSGNHTLLLTQLVGFMGFCLSTMCVLDCVMMDNTLRLIATDASLLQFLSARVVFLGTPTRLLVGSIACNYLQILGLVWEIYQLLSILLVMTVLVAVAGAASIRRYVLFGRVVAGNDFNAGARRPTLTSLRSSWHHAPRVGPTRAEIGLTSPL